MWLDSISCVNLFPASFCQSFRSSVVVSEASETRPSFQTHLSQHMVCKRMTLSLHSCQAGKHATLARSLPNSPFVMIALVADGTLNCERKTKQRKMITFGSPLEELKTEATVWHFTYFHITKIFWLSNQGPNSTWPEDTVWINHQERKLHPPSQRKDIP